MIDEQATASIRKFLSSIVPVIWLSWARTVVVTRDSDLNFTVETYRDVPSTTLSKSQVLKVRDVNGNPLRDLRTFDDYLNHAVEWLAHEMSADRITRIVMERAMTNVYHSS